MTLQRQASEAIIYARGARARKVRSKDKQRNAELLTARVLLKELRKSGKHYSRKIDEALRG